MKARPSITASFTKTSREEECHSVPKMKCIDLPRTVQETIHEEECSTEFNQECNTRYEQQQCAPIIEKKCTTGTVPSTRLSMRGIVRPSRMKSVKRFLKALS